MDGERALLERRPAVGGEVPVEHGRVSAGSRRGCAQVLAAGDDDVM